MQSHKNVNRNNNLVKIIGSGTNDEMSRCLYRGEVRMPPLPSDHPESLFIVFSPCYHKACQNGGNSRSSSGGGSSGSSSSGSRSLVEEEIAVVVVVVVVVVVA